MEKESGAQNEISVFSTYAAREDRATLILLSFFFFFFSEISHSWFASSTSSRAFNVNFMPDSFLLEGESLRGNSKGEEKLFPRFSPPVYPNLR